MATGSEDDGGAPRRAHALASVLIGALILPRAWKRLRETVDVALEATPEGVELTRVGPTC
jgi:cobalt-zinc-cadmium efflux system protein